MPGFVYLWTNKVNNKKYIGSHIGTVDDGYIGSGTAFNRAIKKYGLDSFERTILEHVVNDEEILKVEQKYLDKHNVFESREFYNSSPHAGGGWEHVNKDTKRIEDNINRLKMRWKERPHPRGMLGKKHTKENIEKTKEGWNKWAKENLLKPVQKFSIDGDFIEEFSSISEAARAVNGSPSNIKYTIEGRFKSAYGYKWKYKQ